MSVPDFSEIHKLSLQSLRNLSGWTIERVDFNYDLKALKFTLKDKQSCKAGTSGDKFDRWESFYSSNKITKLVMIIHKDESRFIRINFWSGQSKFERLDGRDDWFVK